MIFLCFCWSNFCIGGLFSLFYLRGDLLTFKAAVCHINNSHSGCRALKYAAEHHNNKYAVKHRCYRCNHCLVNLMLHCTMEGVYGLSAFIPLTIARNNMEMSRLIDWLMSDELRSLKSTSYSARRWLQLLFHLNYLHQSFLFLMCKFINTNFQVLTWLDRPNICQGKWACVWPGLVVQVWLIGIFIQSDTL